MKRHRTFIHASLVMLPLMATADIRLDQLEMPPGFEITVYAEVPNARQMALGDDGTLFVGSRRAGKIHAVIDGDGDQRGEQVVEIDDGLWQPSGVAFRDGALWVGAKNRILRYDDIENRLDDPPEPVVVTNDFPRADHHGWKYLAFDDGWLYVPVGAPCNICLREGFAEIRRIRPDGSGMEVYAEGIRNSVGMDFHPVTGELWFTDNGRDHMGDNRPYDELNHAPRPGLHFGYPFCHQGDLPDPEFGDQRACGEFTPPEIGLGPHVAALGMKFYGGDMFPGQYRGDVFIAEHGSWNRSEKIGYRVKRVMLNDDFEVTGQEVFIEGWLQGETPWGRPADVLVMPDGALLVADDLAGVVYRVAYRGDS